MSCVVHYALTPAELVHQLGLRIGPLLTSDDVCYFEIGRNQSFDLIGSGAEIDAIVKIRYQHHCLTAAGLLVIDDLINNTRGFGGGPNWHSAYGLLWDSVVVEINKPVVACRFHIGCVDQFSWDKIEITQSGVIARIERSTSRKQHILRLSLPVRICPV